MEAQLADLARHQLLVALEAEVLEANLPLELPVGLGVQRVDLEAQRLLLADSGQLADLEVQLLLPVGLALQRLVDLVVLVQLVQLVALAVQQAQLVVLERPVQPPVGLDLLRLRAALALRPLLVASVPPPRPAVLEQHLPQAALAPLPLHLPAVSEGLVQLLLLRLPASVDLLVGSAH